MSFLRFLPVFIFLFLFSCTATTTTTVKTTSQNINEVVKYEGPKARIAVARFDCKAAKCYGEIGTGIKDMLVDALMRTGKFIVLERGEGFEAIKEEINLGQEGYLQSQKAPQKGLLEGADIVIVGSIVAFEPNAGGFNTGGLVGGLLSKVPVIGGVKVGKQDAYIAAVIRLVDVRTGRVLSSTRVEGKASSFKIGGLGGLLSGSVGLGAGLETYKNTPMEKAIMVMIDNAVKEIAKNIPEEYYRYKNNNSSAPQVKKTKVSASQVVSVEKTSSTTHKTKEIEKSYGKDIEGAWYGKYYGHVGSGEWAWVIWKNPDGTYSGRLNTTGTYPGENIPIRITLQGNKIKVGWVVPSPVGEISVTFSGVVENNKMRGTWMFTGGYDSGTWEGVRGRTELTPKLR